MHVSIKIRHLKPQYSKLRLIRIKNESNSETSNFRTESDSFGTVEIPASKYWGIQTQRFILFS